MIYVGYMDPLPSQLRKILSGSTIELDNKAIEAFKLTPAENEQKTEINSQDLFPSLSKFYSGLSDKDSVSALLR